MTNTTKTANMNKKAPMSQGNRAMPL